MLDDATMGRMTGHQHTDDASGSTRKLTYATSSGSPTMGGGTSSLTECTSCRRVRIPASTIVASHGAGSRQLPGSDANLAAVLYAPMDCVLTMFDIVEPDLLVVLDDQKKIITKKNIRGMPAIAIEILSDGTRAIDEESKRALYERAGAREYWIVDGDGDCLTVYRRDGKHFANASNTALRSAMC